MQIKLPTLIPLLLCGSIAACSGASSNAGSGDDDVKAGIVPASFNCATPTPNPNTPNLTISTSKDGTVTVGELHVTPVKEKLDAKHHANLGNFDTFEGSYDLTLDAAMIAGKAGTAHLVYNDPDNSKTDTTYGCKVGSGSNGS
jgi:hypothetical protein